MERIEKPGREVIIEFDGVVSSGVYIGPVADMRRVNGDLKWREEHETGETIMVLTLNEIAEQLADAFLITVVVEAPLSGRIYQYGNYSDASWWQIGELDGYA